MPNELPKRKPTRLKNHDYSTVGAYFVTICVQDRKTILSDIIMTVGEGLAPPEYKIVLSSYGEIVEKELLKITERYECVTVEEYVIMPDHIHAIVILHRRAGGASPSPTISDIICTFKSLTTRICKQNFGEIKMFQRGYYDHIIRDREDYETRRRYIYENPIKWYYEHL